MPIQEQTFAINKIIRTFVDTHADIRNMHRATFYHFGAFSNSNVLYMLDRKQIIYAQSFIAHLSVPKRWFEAIVLIVVTTGRNKL